MFQLAGINDLSTPLTMKELRNKNSKVNRTLIYIYSMETFIPYELNRACRDQNVDMVPIYGPLAAALSYIISSSTYSRQCSFRCCGHRANLSTVNLKLYRGASFTEEWIN